MRLSRGFSPIRSSLGVDLGRIAAMGGGGAVVAGAAILARDRGVRLARQILIYPILDDRNQTPDPHIAPFATWSYDGNFTGWSALLGDGLGQDDVSPISAPARLRGFGGLPPIYIETGELDIFRDEDAAFAQAMAKAGVSVELHVHPGAPHGFDRLAPGSQVTLRAKQDRLRTLRSI
jgi:acetyl esterase/lipase